MRIDVYTGRVETSERWELYRVLAEPARLRVLALVAAEELTVGELAELLRESQPNASRHIAPLRDAGIVTVRKQGTRSLVRLRDGAELDPVVADALGIGKKMAEKDGSLARAIELVRARDVEGREFFAKGKESGADVVPAELGPYLAAFAHLLPRRALAVDAGTGDGGLLEVLAPAFTKVIAIDRSEAQLGRARARTQARGYANVEFFGGDVEEAAAHCGPSADVVFAVRLLHHAPSPKELLAGLAGLLAPEGVIVVLDYALHDDERMRDEADLWLGFEPAELLRWAKHARLLDVSVSPLPSPRGGPDAHLPWQVLIGHAKASATKAALKPLRKSESKRFS